MAMRTKGLERFLARADPRKGPHRLEAAHLAEEAASGEPGCSVKQLPERLLMRAAEVASRLNPVNEPVFGRIAAAAEGALLTPMMAAVITSKYWGLKPRRLTVSFMDNAPVDLRRRIVTHLNAWARFGCIEFVETSGVGQIRIAREPKGYWSYLGTDVLLIPQHLPTLNLQGFTMSTDESEFRRVVRHEAGHTLGMPHEHMRRQLVERIDRQKAYDYFLRTQGWNRSTVDQQVLTPLEDASIMATPADEDSIMCYQLPGGITIDGKPIRGGVDITASDADFVAKIYPRAGGLPAMGRGWTENDWPESDDVQDEDLLIDAA
ncbi:peptidase M12 [Corallococcus sp. AB004]|uniref:M12 family metallopeptidase n=1 Tax=Corallococcus TaxID=83461 RepID=UPI000EA1CE1F|nr:MULTISPECIES: M12 family metallopeptidase [Corallococcus]RKH97077.1 peptidase M12 [Corallococcus sp. AB038B]RKI40561.1 peptidase M12 [Corallococcus sp. AB004]NPC45938.1 peptidase M12 [Corallococcus exiguus]NRD44932.1 peptidase M12 [Corallococcus exiguus]RKH83473.1 peptidase M12 [Corallococcus sp. AB032C]